MSQANALGGERERTGQVFEILIRLGLVFLLLFWGLRIVAPFLNPLAWGAIVAVALHPAFQRLATLIGGRTQLAGGIFIAAGLALVIVPAGSLAAGSMEGVRALAERWQEGELRIPPPSDRVQSVPLIGPPVYAAWLEASQNVEATLQRFAPQLEALGKALLSLAASTGGVLLLLTFSLVIAGALLIKAETAAAFAHKLARRLIGAQGEDFLQLATRTIRGVAVGVIGTAVIQAAGASLGFVLMEVPLAGLWGALVLGVGVIQLPTALVLLPIVVWGFTSHGTVAAIVFAVWCVLIAGSDNVLKPLLMGRGQDVPMLVLLIGSLGGMLLSGILGLFVGAVVLAVIYRLFMAWLAEETPAAPAQAPR